jgi:hypothetical protein
MWTARDTVSLPVFNPKVQPMKIVTKNAEDLRPHPLNKELYGPPNAVGSAYKEIRADMQRRGFDEQWPLKITERDVILWGTTRWAVAKSLAIKTVPCHVFKPESTTEADIELELRREIIRGNVGREKTQVMIAREQRELLEVESALARRRMGGDSDGGPSKSTDRVGLIFKESGKTVTRRIKVLRAIETAEAKGDRKQADQLTDLLNARSLVKALNVIKGTPAKPKKSKPADVPRTLLDCVNKAYSEFYEACVRVQVESELDILKARLQQMASDLNTARERLHE